MLHHHQNDESSFSQPMIRRDFISLLPKRGSDHVAEDILSYLDAKSLCAAELVCEEWYQVISEGMLWKKIIERRVRTDSLWRRVMERRGWIKYLFKPSPGEPHPDNAFYRRLYPKIKQDIENIETNWRYGRHSLKRINCETKNSVGACRVYFDNHKIVSAIGDDTIKIWDLNTLQCIKVLTVHTGRVLDIWYESRVIISISDDSTATVWNDTTGEQIYATIYRSNIADIITSQRFLVDGHRVVLSTSFEKYSVSANSHGKINLWNSATGEWVRTLAGHKGGVSCVRYRKGLVVSGGRDKTIRLWDVERGACLRTLRGHKDVVTCIDFDKKRIVSGCDDGEIKVWDLVAAQNHCAPAETLCLRTLVGHSGSVSDIQLDDFQMVSCSSDDTILIWDFLDGTPETPAMLLFSRYA